MTKYLLMGLVLAGTVGLGWTPLLMAQARLEPDTVAPSWENLIGTDGHAHSLSDLEEYDFVVICFTCNSCPYAIDYEDRLVGLQRQFSSAGEGVAHRVALVAINSNDTAEDRLELMKERAEAKGFQFLYLRDPDQAVAKAYQAMYTPEFFLLDRDRKLRYQGALDDATREADVRVSYVQQAITAIASGQDPPQSYVGARGCKIRFSKPKRTL